MTYGEFLRELLDEAMMYKDWSAATDIEDVMKRTPNYAGPALDRLCHGVFPDRTLGLLRNIRDHGVQWGDPIEEEAKDAVEC